MSMQKPVTKEQYKQQTPMAQGYISYMQGSWNPDVPNGNPYKENTTESNDWEKGNFRAMLDVQDGEE